MLALRDLRSRRPACRAAELEPRVNQLFDDLAARGVTLRPDCYLGRRMVFARWRPRYRHTVLSGASRVSRPPEMHPHDGSRGGARRSVVPEAAPGMNAATP